MDNERINVLHIGCGLFPATEFVESLASFMQNDPRIDISPEEVKSMQQGFWNRAEEQRLLDRLNKHLGGIVIQEPMIAYNRHQKFYFNLTVSRFLGTIVSVLVSL
jgi:hypothetical protein